AKWLDEDDRLHEEKLREKILAEIQTSYDAKCERIGNIMIEIEKQVMLQVLDNAWKDHLANMDHLRQGINLRSYAQKNPKQEYKREAFELFQQLLETVKRETIHLLARVEPITREQMEEMERQRREALERQKMLLNMSRSLPWARNSRLQVNHRCRSRLCGRAARLVEMILVPVVQARNTNNVMGSSNRAVFQSNVCSN